MKKLMMLTAFCVLTASAVGCHHCRWRGAACRPVCAPAPACSPCGDGPAIEYGGPPVIQGDTYLAPPPAVVPGPIVQ